MRSFLIVKENVGTELGKDPAFIHTAQKEGLIHSYIPFAQSCRHPSVGGGTAGGDDGGFKKSSVRGIFFTFFIFQCSDPAKFCEKIRQRSGGMGFLRLFRFGNIKIIDAGIFVDGFCTVVGKDTVKVEGFLNSLSSGSSLSLLSRTIPAGKPFERASHTSFSFAERKRATL